MEEQTMETQDLNYLSVLVAALAYMLLGAIWYSPALFGGMWMKCIGKTKEQVAASFSPINYLWGIITSFIASYGIARIMYWAGRDTVYDGIVIGIFAGICFVLTTLGINDVFESRPKSLTLINVVYHIAGFVIIGVIIGLW
jgi:hypothetical protein